MQAATTANTSTLGSCQTELATLDCRMSTLPTVSWPRMPSRPTPHYIHSCGDSMAQAEHNQLFRRQRPPPRNAADQLPRTCRPTTASPVSTASPLTPETVE